MPRRLVFSLCAVFLGLAAGLLLTELVLQFTLPDRIFYRINISSTGGNYRLVDNPKLIYIPVANTGSFNAYGHRGPALPFRKSGRKRIVALGDSVVEGLGVELGQRFTDILAQSLQGQYDLVNLGVCGYSLLQESEYFQLLGEKFAPDHVLWFITFNDMRLHSGEIYTFNEALKAAPHGAFYATYYKTRIGLDRFLLSLNTYKLIKYFCAVQAPEVFNNNEERISLEEADSLLKQQKDLAKERHYRLTFIFLPCNTKIYDPEINDLKNLIRNNNLPCLDLRETFQTYSASIPLEKYFLGGDCCHFSLEGNKAFADILYKHRGKLGL